MPKLMASSLLLLAIGLSGCSSDAPVTVELGQNTYWGTPQLRITAIVDSVTITNLEVNHGNCSPTPQDPLPKTLGMGNVLKVEVGTCQSVIEVGLETSEGNYDFSFDN